MAPKRANPNGGGFTPTAFLNLERVPTLAPKFANQIGKTVSGFVVTYNADGVDIAAQSLLDANGIKINDADLVSVVEWERRRALHNAPTDEERLTSLRRKYELRLNRAFPAQGPASGREADIQAWLGTLGFAERRALLMSQKDFSKSYPDGFRA